MKLKPTTAQREILKCMQDTGRPINLPCFKYYIHDPEKGFRSLQVKTVMSLLRNGWITGTGDYGLDPYVLTDAGRAALGGSEEESK